MKILVTGSTGFIGSQLCHALISAGHQVRAFHRPSSSLLALQGLPVEHAIGDITAMQSLQSAMQGIEVVFHAAALLGPERHPGEMAAVTVAGTRNVLNAAASAGVRRLVHTSSVAALGVPPPPHNANSTPFLMDETHTWNYRSAWWPYGSAKYQAELEVQRAVAKGLDVVIVNPAIVVGAGDLNRVSGNIIIHVAKGHVPVSIAGGLNIVHIDTVVAGHLAALERGKRGERYILAGENLTHQRFLEITASVTGAPPPRGALPVSVARPLAVPLQVLSDVMRVVSNGLPIRGDMFRLAGYYFYYETTRMVDQLGVQPGYSVRQAVEEAYHWYQSQGMLK